MDYCKLSALLGAWDDASLSAEEERELEACVSDSDYEILAAEADAFISSLAAGEKNARRRPQWGVWLSAAAACVAVMAVAVWLFIPGSGTENATQMAAVETVKPTETVKIQDDYKDSAPAPVPASVVPRKAYAHRQICVVAEQPEDTLSRYDHFIIIRSKLVITIIKNQLNLSMIHWSSHLTTSENNIFHIFTT